MKALFILTAFLSLFTLSHAQKIDHFISRGYVDGFLSNGWKGNPKSVEIIDFTINQNHQLTDEIIRIKNTYDENERHISSILISDSTSESTFEYNEQNQLVKFSMPNSEEVFSYNDKGQVVESILTYNSDKLVEFKIYLYNSANTEAMLSKIKGNSIVSETLHKMEKKDSIIEVTTFNLEMEKLKPIQKAQFDKNEQIISLQLFDPNSKVYRTSFYTYNNNGDIDKIKIIGLKDDVEFSNEITEIHYEYDTHGNKIKEKKTINGILMDYTEYKIEYE